MFLSLHLVLAIIVRLDIVNFVLTILLAVTVLTKVLTSQWRQIKFSLGECTSLSFTRSFVVR